MKRMMSLIASVASLMFLPTCGVGQSDPSDVVSAINAMKTSIINTLNNSTFNINRQISTTFDEIFKGQFAKDKIVNYSTLDTKINLYVKNFYSWFTTKEFTNLELTNQDKTNMNAIHELASREIGYNTKKNILERFLDTKALLAQPFEQGNNNISYTALGLAATNQTSTPYGSLDDKAPLAADAPNISDLIGNDSYSDKNAQNKAKLFINHLLQIAPPFKNFYLPPPERGKPVYIYLPNNSAHSSEPYKSITIATTTTEGKQTTEYERMVNFLNTESKFYQPYKLKVRTANVLRTLYTESLNRAYQERVKDQRGKSLVEREKEAATAGLNKSYYDNLKNKSVADINLETLHSINKLVYFVYKLHQDNERLTLLLAANGIQQTAQKAQDDLEYVKPINALIENRCWDVTVDSSPEVKNICADPKTAARSLLN